MNRTFPGGQQTGADDDRLPPKGEDRRNTPTVGHPTPSDDREIDGIHHCRYQDHGADIQFTCSPAVFVTDHRNDIGAQGLGLARVANPDAFVNPCQASVLEPDAEFLRGGMPRCFNDANAFFNDEGYCNSLMKKATFYAQQANTYNINCLFSYSEVFREFNAWYVQLWGESLGKKQRHSELHVGLTPVGLIGPTDQHSFLQLIVEGKRDKSVTVIKIKEFNNTMRIPDNSFENLEAMDLINGFDFSELINMQADSIIEALDSLDNIPLDVIEIESVNASEIGQLILYYELLTALVANMLDINAYDQPGVEMGKIILKEKLQGK